MKNKYKFFVMLTLFLMGGLVSPEIKAQKGHPIVARKANGQDYTKAEIKAKLSQTGPYWDMVRTEITKLINGGLEKSGESLRVKTSHIGWILDSSVYVPKNEYGDEINNGYTVDYKSMKYVTTRKTEGNYLVFQYKKCSIRFLDPSCLNPQEEIESEKKQGQNISETPESQSLTEANAQSYSTQSEECWEYVWREEPYYTTETQRITQYAGVGENTGYYGTRYSSNRTYQVRHTRKVLYKVPCGQSQQDQLPVMNEEIPRDEKGEPEKSWCESHPVLCTMLLNARINVGVQVSGNNNNGYYYGGGNTTGGTYTPNGGPGGPTPTGGPGGPTPTGGNGGPGGPKPRGR